MSRSLEQTNVKEICGDVHSQSEKSVLIEAQISTHDDNTTCLLLTTTQ